MGFNSNFSFEVELINKQDYQTKNLFKRWGEFACICYNTPLERAEKVGKVCLETGHFSGSRPFPFIFHLTLPRFAADQLARHSVGTAINMESQRYVRVDNFNYYLDPLIENSADSRNIYINHMEETKEVYSELVEALNNQGILGEGAHEQARGVLPMNIQTKMAISFNLESLINLANKRLCLRTQYLTRLIVKEICKEVVDLIPELQQYLVPQCQKLLYCPEGNLGKNCPLRLNKNVINKKELQEKLNTLP